MVTQQRTIEYGSNVLCNHIAPMCYVITSLPCYAVYRSNVLHKENIPDVSRLKQLLMYTTLDSRMWLCHVPTMVVAKSSHLKLKKLKNWKFEMWKN